MCGHSSGNRRRASGRDIDLRVSNAERDEVVERLRVAAAEGRLELGELEERIEVALSARTRRDLAGLLSDLPSPDARQTRGGFWRVMAAGSTAAVVLPLVLAILLFALAPAAISWIGWVLIGWWFFAGLPAAGVDFAGCGMPSARDGAGPSRSSSP